MIITSIWFPNEFYLTMRGIVGNCIKIVINLLCTSVILLLRQTKEIDDKNLDMTESIYIEKSPRI